MVPTTDTDILASIVDRLAQGGLHAVSAATVDALRTVSDRQLQRTLRTAGAIPERYACDSKEEKAYGKAADALVAVALERLGFVSELVTARSNRPDVIAVDQNGTVVLEVKTVRLSRTATNPKDFKIPTVDTWRTPGGKVAIVAPPHIYPGPKSRLWIEAAEHQVALLGFDHLDAAIGNRTRPDTLFDPVLSPQERLAALGASRHLTGAYKAASTRRLLQELDWVTAERDRCINMSREDLLSIVSQPLAAKVRLLSARAGVGETPRNMQPLPTSSSGAQ